MNITKFLRTPIWKNTWERQSMFTWEAKWTQTGMRFHLGWKSHLGIESALYLCSLELSRNETQNRMDFTSVILTEIKFKTSMRFSCENEMDKRRLLDVAFNADVSLKLNTSTDFILVILREEISFRAIKYHVYTTRNEMSAHVHQNIGLFWNAASCEQKLFARWFEISNRYKFTSPLMWTYS